MRIDCFVCVMFLLLLWSLNPESSEKVSLFVIFHDFPWIWMLGRQHFTPWSYSLVNLFFYMMIADKDVSHFVIVKQFGKRLCLAVLFMLSLTYNNPWVRCFQKEETKSLFFPRWHVTCSRSEESLDYLLLITIFVFVASSISKCECLLGGSGTCSQMLLINPGGFGCKENSESFMDMHFQLFILLGFRLERNANVLEGKFDDIDSVCERVHCMSSFRASIPWINYVVLLCWLASSMVSTWFGQRVGANLVRIIIFWLWYFSPHPLLTTCNSCSR